MNRCAIDCADNSLAPKAVAWLRAFLPDIDVAVIDGQVHLESSRRGEADLRLAWHAALSNERLLQKGASQRAAIMADLVQ